MTDSTKPANSYWHDTGKYEATAERLQKLVPGSGKADTTAGEIWRCAVACYYDYFCNGCCNSRDYAIDFLTKAGVFKKARNEKRRAAIRQVKRISQLVNGCDLLPYLDRACNEFIDHVCEFIDANPHLETEPNEIDSLEVWYAADKKRKAEARARRWR